MVMQRNVTRATIQREILELKNTVSKLRSTERDIVNETKFLQMTPLVSNEGNLKDNLSKILPKYLLPTNTGKYHQILTPFWYTVNFRIGTDPMISKLSKFVENFQVTQEAGFLLTHISRNFKGSETQAGENLPMGITIRDNQSSRQFNNEPIMLQSLGESSRATKLETPFLLNPNASVSIEMSSLTTTDDDVQYDGDGFQQIMFGGYRVNIADKEFLQEQIFL